VLIVHKNTVGGEIWCSFLFTHAFLLGNGQTYATRGVPYYRVSRIFMSRIFHPCNMVLHFHVTLASWCRKFMSCIFSVPFFSSIHNRLSSNDLFSVNSAEYIHSNSFLTILITAAIICSGLTLNLL